MVRILEHIGIRRGGSLLIDLLLVSVLSTLLLNTLPNDFLETQWSWHGYVITISSVLYGLILVLYFLGCDLFNGGNSLGKDILGLRTTGPGDEALCMSHRLVRTLLKIIGIGMLPVSLLLFIWKGSGFTLQDYVLRSTVVRSRNNGFAH